MPETKRHLPLPVDLVSVQNRACFTSTIIIAQWRRHTRACQGKCPGRNTSALAAALAAKSGNNKIIYQEIDTALTDATSDLTK